MILETEDPLEIYLSLLQRKTLDNHYDSVPGIVIRELSQMEIRGLTPRVYQDCQEAKSKLSSSENPLNR